MAYIESSLLMYRGESHKLLSGNFPTENGGSTTSGRYGMVYKNGEIIWEILGRKGRQVVIPIALYENYSWNGYTVIIDIDKGSYLLQGSVGQGSNSGFIVSDNGIMVLNYLTFVNERYSWCNISTNGAVFYSPDTGRKLTGPVRAYFGKDSDFYGVGESSYALANKLIKLTVDEHGTVKDEEVVDDIEGLTSALNIKYKGSDFCLLYINRGYQRYNLTTHELSPISSNINAGGLQWLTDGKFAYIRTDNNAVYIVITSNFISDDEVIYADAVGYSASYIDLYCRYPYVYIWRQYREASSDSRALRIIKINVVTKERQATNPDSIKIGDITFCTKRYESVEAPYYNLWDYHRIFWNYNEYFDDGVLKDDLQGGYGTISLSSGRTYAIYMDNLELRPSENNMAILIS